jgi:amidophosphoribosyltransferase
MREDRPREAIYAEMARELGADSLRYLPVESIARAVDRPASELCRACLTGQYPTPHGQQLYQIALANVQAGAPSAATGSRPVRTYETPGSRV